MISSERSVLQGKSLMLRRPQESDKLDRLAAGRNAEFRKMVGGDPYDCPPLTQAEVEQWYIQICQEPLQWIIEYTGRCIGEARLHSVDQSNRSARYAIGIFDPRNWSRGLGTEATRLVLQFAFDKMKLHRVDLRVLAFNKRAIACYEKCGFVREGVVRESVCIGDEWQSDILMSVLEHEYKSGTV
jgi:RimJ/RimL family protein N-acetyltransferase